MSKAVKKSLSVLLVLAMLFSAFAITAFCETEDEGVKVTPRFTTISTVSTSFTISGIKATAFVGLTAQYETSLSIKIELQKEKSGGYETIESWAKSATSTYLNLEESKLINIFSDYRIKVTCIADGEKHITYDYP